MTDDLIRLFARAYTPRLIIWSSCWEDYGAVLINGMSLAGAKKRLAWLGDVPVWQQGFNGA